MHFHGQCFVGHLVDLGPRSSNGSISSLWFNNMHVSDGLIHKNAKVSHDIDVESSFEFGVRNLCSSGCSGGPTPTPCEVEHFRLSFLAAAAEHLGGEHCVRYNDEPQLVRAPDTCWFDVTQHVAPLLQRRPLMFVGKRHMWQIPGTILCVTSSLEYQEWVLPNEPYNRGVLPPRNLMHSSSIPGPTYPHHGDELRRCRATVGRRV